MPELVPRWPWASALHREPSWECASPSTAVSSQPSEPVPLQGPPPPLRPPLGSACVRSLRPPSGPPICSPSLSLTGPRQGPTSAALPLGRRRRLVGILRGLSTHPEACPLSSGTHPPTGLSPAVGADPRHTLGASRILPGTQGPGLSYRAARPGEHPEQERTEAKARSQGSVAPKPGPSHRPQALAEAQDPLAFRSG